MIDIDECFPLPALFTVTCNLFSLSISGFKHDSRREKRFETGGGVKLRGRDFFLFHQNL